MRPRRCPALDVCIAVDARRPRGWLAHLRGRGGRWRARGRRSSTLGLHGRDHGVDGSGHHCSPRSVPAARAIRCLLVGDRCVEWRGHVRGGVPAPMLEREHRARGIPGSRQRQPPFRSSRHRGTHIASRSARPTASATSLSRATSAALSFRSMTERSQARTGSEVPTWLVPRRLLVTDTIGNELTGPRMRARRIALVATAWSSCGTVEVRWNHEVLARVDLSSAGFHPGRIFPVANFDAVRWAAPTSSSSPTAPGSRSTASPSRRFIRSVRVATLAGQGVDRGPELRLVFR